MGDYDVSMLRFLLGKKCTLLVSDVDNGEDTHVFGAGVYEKSLYLLLNFVVNLKLL